MSFLQWMWKLVYGSMTDAISSIQGWAEAGCGWKSRLYSTFGLGGNVPVPIYVSPVAFLKSATYSYVASSIAMCLSHHAIQGSTLRLLQVCYEIGSYEPTAACLLSYVQLHYSMPFIPPPYNVKHGVLIPDTHMNSVYYIQGIPD